MSEKKKRVRPTVAQVNELKAQIIVLEQSIQALKGLISKKEEVLMNEKALNNSLGSNLAALKEVIERKDKYIHKLEEKDTTLEKENTRLKRRGFWERVFNL